MFTTDQLDRPQSCTAMVPSVSPLTVTLLNMHARHGGAERCANDLRIGLGDHGHTMRMLVGHADDPQRDLNEQTALLTTGRVERAAQKIAHGLFGLTDTVLQSPLRAVHAHPWLAGADLIHGHNLGGGWFNLQALPRLAAARPIVVTLHDMWLLTGDCEFSGSCDRWQRQCGECPIFRKPRRKRGAVGGMDLTRLNLQIKRDVASRIDPSRLMIVTPSRWLGEKARRSLLGRFEVRVVFNGVDSKTFAPEDQQETRRRLNLHLNQRLLGAVAGNWDDPRKGGDMLIDIARWFGPRNDFSIIAAGKMSPPRQQSFEAAGIITLPDNQNDEELRRLYAACDVALVLSREENLPYSVSEPLACGCPVLAMGVGGIPEMFDDGRHGWLVPPADSTAGVVATIGHVLRLSADQLTQMRTAARIHAKGVFSLERMCQCYGEIYREMIAGINRTKQWVST